MMFLSCIIVTRSVVIPIGSFVGVSKFLTFSISFSFVVVARIAIGTLLLGIIIVARYISPPSIMRLSSSPMYVNQFTGLIKSILYSPDSFLKFITMPNNN